LDNPKVHPKPATATIMSDEASVRTRPLCAIDIANGISEKLIAVMGAATIAKNGISRDCQAPKQANNNHTVPRQLIMALRLIANEMVPSVSSSR
jgi:hypothetical protein